MSNSKSSNTKAQTTKVTESAEPMIETTAAAVVEQTVQPEQYEKKKPLVPKALDPNQLVTVYNGFQGKLVYKSKKTGEEYVWSEFGVDQDMELSELKNIRSSNKKYFTNNWFMFDDPEIIEYLGMTQYYKFALKINEFDSLFEMNPGEMCERIEKLSDGQKKSVAYRAKQLIAEGGIDSHKTITTLEKCLGIELIER